jgi:ParB-like chromosome segregation protein Spo0J
MSGTELTLPDTITLPIGDIAPYWRNPRRITEQSVQAVATSIERYGYQQPIIVDRDHVVIVGHTRLEALKKLGWKQVPVYVSDLSEEKAKEYRLIDNRTGEMTDWDHNALVMELREWEVGLLESFFPEVDLGIKEATASTDVTDDDLKDADRRIHAVTQANALTTHTTQVECPACFHTFEVRTKSLPGLTWDDLQGMVSEDGETG